MSANRTQNGGKAVEVNIMMSARARAHRPPALRYVCRVDRHVKRSVELAVADLHRPSQHPLNRAVGRVVRPDQQRRAHPSRLLCPPPAAVLLIAQRPSPPPPPPQPP